MNGAPWPSERIELLGKLWADGLSASQIAKQLGGITKNAVIGKAYRLGFISGKVTKKNTPPDIPPQAPTPPHAARVKKAAPVEKSRPAAVDTYHKATYAIPAQPVERAVYGAGRVTFMQLERHHCRWPMDTNFCGDNAVDGRPYCKYHCGVAGRKYGT